MNTLHEILRTLGRIEGELQSRSRRDAERTPRDPEVVRACMIDLSQSLFFPRATRCRILFEKNVKNFGHFARSRVLDKYEQIFIGPRWYRSPRAQCRYGADHEHPSTCRCLR
jgi:hypothetical protein